MKHKNRFSDWFVTVGFVLFLAGAMMLTSRSARTDTFSYYENRSLAAFPQVTAEGLASGEWGTQLDRFLSDHAGARGLMLRADTAVNTYLLRRPLVNEVVVNPPYLLPELHQTEEELAGIPTAADHMARNLMSVRDAAQKNGAYFLYVAVPSQYVFHADQYPWYTENRSDYTKQSTQALWSRLDGVGVPYLDLAERFEAENWREELSSAVDNHFSMEGAYLSYQEILNRIVADTGLSIPAIGDYTMEQLPNPYLGSRMRKMMGLWRSDEKLSVLIPDEQIPFERRDNGEAVEAAVYDLPRTETEEVLYSLYMGGDVAHTEIETHRPELPSVLIYGDSFTNAVECLLYTGFDRMDSIDLRHYEEQTLEELIETLRPDVVICLRDYGVLLDPTNNGQSADGQE